MPKELKKLRVSFVSLVDKGANQKQIVWKSAGEADSSHLVTIPIINTDEEQRIVEGIVYAPGEVDSHGHYANALTIKSAAYDFMRQRNTTNVDVQHNLVQQDAYVAESWIVQKGDARFPDNPGAWAVAIKVNDDAIWKSVKSGEISGISLYGTAMVQQKSALRKVWDSITNSFTDVVEADELTHSLERLVWTLDKVIRQIATTENEDKTKQINTAIDEFIEHVQGLKIAKAGAVLSAANLKSLTEALAMLKRVIDTALGQTTQKKTGGRRNERRGNQTISRGRG